MDDHPTIVKALAKLLSHRVELDISSLYDLTQETEKKNKLTQRNITLGGKSITATILSEENRQIFQNLASKTPNNTATVDYQRVNPVFNSLNTPVVIATNNQPVDDILLPTNQPEEIAEKNIMEHGLVSTEQLQSFEITTTLQKPTQPSFTPSNITRKPGQTIRMLDLNKTQYQKLNANNANLTKSHTAFLKSRQDFSQQMSEIIQLQLACAQNLLKEEA